jgi:ketosteroid isomerase-like protein
MAVDVAQLLSFSVKNNASDLHPAFFDWQRQGSVFEIVDLDVTAGDDVAFAHALLRCGTPSDLEKDPANRLRLSIGLRKEHGRWIVTHEHHSFPLP